MTSLDLTQLSRSTVGFDRLFHLLEDSRQWTGGESYPPYNIERTGDDQYRIALALAGFTPDEVTVTADQNALAIEGRPANEAEHEYLYQGISSRPFRRVFNLADYIQVKSAVFDNGLLTVDVVRELPDAMKPRRIAIDASDNHPMTEPQGTA